jgi:hypothetical protein
MTSEPNGQVTLGDASRILSGATPAETSRAMLLSTRGEVLLSWQLIVGEHPEGPPSLSYSQWDHLSRLHVSEEGVVGAAGMAPPQAAQDMIPWLASAPQQHAVMALELAGLMLSRSKTRAEPERLFARLLSGDAGPHARSAVPAIYGWKGTRFRALLDLPQNELESITAPHSNGWPCYSDRMFACWWSDWREQHRDLWTREMTRIAGRDAAAWAQWAQTYMAEDDAMPLFRRLPPSQQMLEVIQRFGSEEIVRELLAAHLARHIQSAQPIPDSDQAPLMDMI